MGLKSLISNIRSGMTSSASSKPTATRKPFTKHRAESPDEINVWGNTEVHAGQYYVDEKDTVDEAVKNGLKAEKLG